MTAPIAFLLSRLHHELEVTPPGAAYCRPFSRALVLELVAALHRQQDEIASVRADMETAASLALELVAQNEITT